MPQKNTIHLAPLVGFSLGRGVGSRLHAKLERLGDVMAKSPEQAMHQAQALIPTLMRGLPALQKKSFLQGYLDTIPATPDWSVLDTGFDLKHYSSCEQLEALHYLHNVVGTCALKIGELEIAKAHLTYALYMSPRDGAGVRYTLASALAVGRAPQACRELIEFYCDDTNGFDDDEVEEVEADQPVSAVAVWTQALHDAVVGAANWRQRLQNLCLNYPMMPELLLRDQDTVTSQPHFDHELCEIAQYLSRGWRSQRHALPLLMVMADINHEAMREKVGPELSALYDEVEDHCVDDLQGHMMPPLTPEHMLGVARWLKLRVRQGYEHFEGISARLYACLDREFPNVRHVNPVTDWMDARDRAAAAAPAP